MVEIYRKIDGELQKIYRITDDCWINISNPSDEEIKSISKELNLDENYIKDTLDMDERSRLEVDKDEGVIAIIFRMPYINEEKEITTIPISIIFKNDKILTVCAKENIINDEFLKKIKIEDFSKKNHNKILLFIFQKIVFLFLKYLKIINKQIEEGERSLHKSMKNEELIRMLDIEKSLVYFTTSLRSNELVLEKLRKINALHFDEEGMDLLEDIMIDNKQAIETAKIYSDILSGMMDAFASIISNNLNIVMKMLASITIILMIPTIVTSFYGMNVKLPFQDSPHAYWIIILISFILSGLGVVIFWKRKWF
ncbi:magnesium transporter CorA family protein [Caminibacter sp.]